MVEESYDEFDEVLYRKHWIETDDRNIDEITQEDILEIIDKWEQEWV